MVECNYGKHSALQRYYLNLISWENKREMKKKTIENRYSIEYIHPTSSTSDSPTQEQSNKGYLLLIILFALLLIAGFLYKSENLSNYLQAFVSTANKSISDNSVLSSDSSAIIELKNTVILNTNISENNDLTNSLDELTEQLVAARKKNSELKNKFKEKQSNEQSLSILLTNSTRTEKIDNTNYLSALNKLNKERKEEKQQIIEVVFNNKTENFDSGMDKNIQNEVPYYTSKNQTTVITKKISDNKTTAVEATEKTKKNLNYNNAISLSTKLQMDAIILAMKTGNIRTSRLSKPKKKPSSQFLTKNNELINQISLQIQTNTNTHEKIEDNNDLISVELKGKINQLIVSKELTSLNYQRALSRESNTRSNAVRSVIVKKGETLWGIAKRAYGDGKHYKKILKANPQLTQKQKLFLVIGQVIRVPK